MDMVDGVQAFEIENTETPALDTRLMTCICLTPLKKIFFLMHSMWCNNITGIRWYRLISNVMFVSTLYNYVSFLMQFKYILLIITLHPNDGFLASYFNKSVLSLYIFVYMIVRYRARGMYGI